MHYSNLLRVSVTLVLSAHRVLGQAIIPYKDGQCTQPVTKYTLNGNAEPESIWANSNGWPSVSRYSNPVFPGAEAKSGGGYNVYWKIGEPGPGCRVAIMTPYSQSSYGSLGFHAPPGNVVLVAKKAGCYFSSIPQGQDFSSTYCCGVGDCKYISVGNSALLKREEEDASLSLFSRESAAESDSIVSHPSLISIEHIKQLISTRSPAELATPSPAVRPNTPPYKLVMTISTLATAKPMSKAPRSPKPVNKSSSPTPSAATALRAPSVSPTASPSAPPSALPKRPPSPTPSVPASASRPVWISSPAPR